MKHSYIFILALLFSFSNIFSQNTYYISSSTGNDNYRGTSSSEPWKSISKVNEISLEPGDKILFKSGDTWDNGDVLKIKGSGNSNNYITFSAYENGEKPIISLIVDLPDWEKTSKWSNYGKNIWQYDAQEYSNARYAQRMWFDKLEYKRAETVDTYFGADLKIPRNTFGVSSEYRFREKSDGKFIYVYAESNPANYYNSIKTIVSKNGDAHVIDINKSNYIRIDGLDIRGGRRCVNIDNSDYVIVENCKVGYNSNQAIRAAFSSDFCIIRNNEVNSQWASLQGEQFQYYSTSYSPYASFLTVNVGIQIGEGASNCKVYNNKVSDFYHNALMLTGINDNRCINNEIFDNEATFDNIPMGRLGHIVAFSSEDGVVSNNKFYRNYGRNPGLNFEIGGNNNYVFFNIIDNGKNARPFVYYAGQGVGISLESGSTRGQCNENFVFNNTVYNVESEPLRVWGYKHHIMNNLVIMGGNGINNFVVSGHDNDKTIMNNCVVMENKNEGAPFARYGNPKKSYTMDQLNSLNSSDNSDSFNGNFQIVGEIDLVLRNVKNSDFTIISESKLDKKGFDISEYIPQDFKDFYGNQIDPKNPPIGAVSDGEAVINTNNENVDSQIKVLLEAPYNSNLMSNQLQEGKILPKTQPFNNSTYNYNGNEEIINEPNDLIDWVLIELRSDLNTSTKRFAGLLNSSGFVLNINGTKDFSDKNINDGNYYIAIYHRNHLAVMSSDKIVIKNSNINYDFTDAQLKAYGNNSMSDLGGGKFAMISGDSDGNNVINNLDFGPVANNIFSSGYLTFDLDMNGSVNILDYSFINRNILKKSNIPNL